MWDKCGWVGRLSVGGGWCGWDVWDKCVWGLSVGGGWCVCVRCVWGNGCVRCGGWWVG